MDDQRTLAQRGRRCSNRRLQKYRDTRRAGVPTRQGRHLRFANLETAPADARLCSCPLLHAVASALVPADGSAVRRRGARGPDKENSLLVVGRDWPRDCRGGADFAVPRGLQRSCDQSGPTIPRTHAGAAALLSSVGTPNARLRLPNTPSPAWVRAERAELRSLAKAPLPRPDALRMGCALPVSEAGILE
jgi:hypothetical protein